MLHDMAVNTFIRANHCTDFQIMVAIVTLERVCEDLEKVLGACSSDRYTDLVELHTGARMHFSRCLRCAHAVRLISALLLGTNDPLTSLDPECGMYQCKVASSCCDSFFLNMILCYRL